MPELKANPDLLAKADALGAVIKLNDPARCTVCFHEGEYRVDVIDTDYYGLTCRDIDACYERTKRGVK